MDTTRCNGNGTGRVPMSHPKPSRLVCDDVQSEVKSEATSPVLFTPDYSSDSSAADDKRLARRQPAESARAVKLIPRSASNQEARRLTPKCQIRPATVFQPSDPLLTPEVHFPLQTVTARTRYPRFVNRFNSREMMLLVDGSCVNNGAGAGKNAQSSEERQDKEPIAGASFIYKNNPSYIIGTHATTMPFLAIDRHAVRGDGGAPLGDMTVLMPDMTGKIALRLELQGPRGDVTRHTSNRAKLRAVIAALDFRPWYGEGWEKIVVVTDLEYVAHGATKWLPVWAKRRWRSGRKKMRGGRPRVGKKIANRDLWEELQSRVEMLRANGAEVSFWLVPPKSLIGRESGLLKEAKSAAREAAKSSPGVVVEEYTKLCGLFV